MSAAWPWAVGCVLIGVAPGCAGCGSEQDEAECGPGEAACVEMDMGDGPRMLVDADCNQPPAPDCDAQGRPIEYAPGRAQGNQCIYDELPGAPCADGEICAMGECVSDGSGEFDELCDAYCSVIAGDCLLQNCTSFTDAQQTALASSLTACLEGGVDDSGNTIPSCPERLGADADERAQALALGSFASQCGLPITRVMQARFIASAFYETSFVDACGLTEPELGTACEAPEACSVDGAPPAACIPELDMSGEPTGFVGGQCVAVGCFPGFDENLELAVDTIVRGESTGCGPEDLCLSLLDADAGTILTQCQPGCQQTPDCDRAIQGADDVGYACSILGIVGDGSVLGRCEPACTTDEDCGGSGVCAPTRACQVGCMQDTDCINGLVCVMDDGRGYCAPPT